jgi:hypothetical protein
VKGEKSLHLQYHDCMNTIKNDRKLMMVPMAEKSSRVATRLVQSPMVIGKRRLTAAQRRVILHAMLKAA